MIASGILLFFIFKNMTIRYNKWINLVAGTVLGTYMIHDNHLVRDALASFVGRIKTTYIHVEYLFVVYILLVILAVFAICTIIEIARKSIFDKLADRLVDFFESSNRILRWKVYFLTLYQKMSIW